MRPAARLSLQALAAALLLLFGVPSFAQEDAWSLLQRPGYVAFLRHAATSGGAGDPSGFKLEDCATQRNLTAAGRAQAERMDAALKVKAVSFQRVFTSPWCRCRETARLVTGTEPEVMEALSNLVGRPEHRDPQVRSMRAYLAALNPGAPVLFVTHGSVIAALTGLNPAEGELVVTRVGPGGETTIAGRLKVD